MAAKKIAFLKTLSNYAETIGKPELIFILSEDLLSTEAFTVEEFKKNIQDGVLDINYGITIGGQIINNGSVTIDNFDEVLKRLVVISQDKIHDITINDIHMTRELNT